MRAKSIKGNSVEAIQVALQDCMLDGFQPTLAIVFISVKQDRKAISELLHQNQIDVFGCTSCGEFTGDHHSDGEMVMLLLDIDRQYYRLLLVEGKDTTVEAAASTLAEQALHQFRSPTFLLSCTGVFADGEYFDGDTLVRVLVDQLGRDCVFFGGMAGDDWAIKNSYVFTTQQESGHAIAALVFDGDRVTLQGIATHGWKPLGLSRKVTKSIGSKIYSIDGQPAVEMYLKYLGMEKKNGDENFDLFKDLSIHFPFIARRKDGETIIKSPRSIDRESNALVMDIEMEEGSEFYFTIPPDFEISDEIIAEADEMKKSLDSQPDALLIFSCAGRPPVLGPLTVMENEGLAKVWELPMAGFYTYGEFGRTRNGQQHFHSAMCCWVTIKEKK